MNPSENDAPAQEVTESPAVETEVVETEQTEAPVEAPVEAEAVEEEAVETETIPKARFNQIYYENKQKERELEQLRAQIAQAPAPFTPTPEQYAQAQNVPMGKPTPEEHNYDDVAFQEALVDWKLNQRDLMARQNAAQQEQMAVVNTFRQKQNEYIANNNDYQDLTTQAERAGIVFSDSVAEAIMESDVGVKVHHHLLSNPEKLNKIQSMTPLQQMREMVKLENTFSKKQTIKTKTAQAVVNPVTGASAPAGNPDNKARGAMSPKDYYAQRMKELKGG